VKLSPVELVASNPLALILSQSAGRDLTVNEGVGARVSWQLPALGALRSSLSFGPDWKHFGSASFNTNIFITRITLTNNGQVTVRDTNTYFHQPERVRAVDYLPLSLGWNGSIADRFGVSSFSLGQSVNLVDLRSYSRAGTNAPVAADTGTFYTVNAGVTRDQRIYEEWGVLIRANGQWANRGLLSTEQFGLGGTSGVRGYVEGEEYGDTGWRVLVEPRLPLIELGLVDGAQPMRARLSVFTDYGERYLINAAGRAASLPQWGAGFGGTLSVSDWLEARLQVAFALLDTPLTTAGSMHLYFSVGAQF
jgi:hemolysin activation/secretion protein